MIALALALVLSLSSCDILLGLLQQECQHTDGDGDGFCDECNEPVAGCDAGMHTDTDCDGYCDECTLELDSLHEDKDKNGACDRCDECIIHVDADRNDTCDNCGSCISHTDISCSGKCTRCGTPIEISHYDRTGDGKCDKCGACLGHKDDNGDGKCDICALCLSHVDSDCSGFCDNCNRVTTVEHKDEDGNGLCDKCGRCLSHIDENCDAKCDRCDAATTVSHIDEDSDGKCNKCGTCIDHRDENCDKSCDNCGESVDLGHADIDNNGKCDKCDACILHKDDNCNGLCDICDTAIEITHRDEDGDTICDGCGAATKPVEITLKKSVSVSEGKTVYPTAYITYSDTTYRGAYLTYTITVTNLGEGAARVEINDTLPYGVAYVSGADTVNGETLGWQITLGVGEEKSISYKVVVTLGEESVGEVILGTSASIGDMTAGCHSVYITNRLNEIDEEYMTLGIRALTVSTFRGFDFAKHAYTIAFTHAKAISDYLEGSASDVLARLFAADSTITAMTAPGLYGGLLLTSPINGTLGIAGKDFSERDLIAGDIILVEKNGISAIYIYDGIDLYDITATATRADLSLLLSEIPSLDRYAVLRPSMTMADFTPSDPDETPEELNAYQEAIVATAKTYLLRGESLQYEDVYFALDSKTGEYRWSYGEKAPEDYTTDEWGYVNCAVFTYDVYWTSLGYTLPSNMYTTERLPNNAASNGMSVFRFERTRADVYTEEEQLEIERQFMATLEVGDIMVRRHTNVATGKTTGHAMLYVGNGRFIHSSGASYAQSGGTGYETYEPTIRCHKVHDYLFGTVSTSMFNDEDNIITIVRPLNKFSGEIPENTLARIENMQGIRAEKLSSHPSSTTVNPGECITFTFSLYNTTNADRIISISDIIPAGTSYVSGGDTVNGNELSWSVTVPARETVNVSYTVKVDTDTPIGTVIDGNDAKIGGVSYRCAAIKVKRTLKSHEQSAILDAITALRTEGTSLSGLALVNEIYYRALGIDGIFADTNADNVIREGSESVFAKSTVSSGGKYFSMLRTDETYYSRMLVDHLYGGMRFYSKNNQHDRTRLLREHNLLIGDVLIGRTSSSVNIYIYAGDGNLLLLNSGVGNAVNFTTVSERIMYFGRDFAVLRPSQVFE